jgi:hypothetical protein
VTVDAMVTAGDRISTLPKMTTRLIAETSHPAPCRENNRIEEATVCTFQCGSRNLLHYPTFVPFFPRGGLGSAGRGF